MDFFKTRMGTKFYNSDLPELIKTLKSISEQLKEQNLREAKKFKLEEKLIRKQLKSINETNGEIRNGIKTSI